MNASEARRAALTAAVAVNATWHMEEPNAILALAERFETWLTRPADVDTEHESGTWCKRCNLVVAWCVHTGDAAGVESSTHQPWTSLWPTSTSTPTRTRPNPYCTVCEHRPHAGPTCTECACPGYRTCTCTDHWHVHGSAPGTGCTVCACTTPIKAPSTARANGDVARVDACVCTFRSSHVACSSCGHDAHDPGDCASTHTYTDPEPVVTLPDPIVDAPCTGFRAGMADSSYGCAHTRLAHGPRGCSVTGCRCERTEGPRVVHDPYMDGPEPDTCTCVIETVYANCPGCGHGRHEPGQCARGPVVIR